MNSGNQNAKDNSSEGGSKEVNRIVPKVSDQEISKSLAASINVSVIEAAKSLSINADTSLMEGVVKNISFSFDTSAIEAAIKSLSIDASVAGEAVKGLCTSINTSAIAEEIMSSYARINDAAIAKISEDLKNLDGSINDYLKETHPKVREYNWFFTPSMDLHLWRYIHDNIDRQPDPESFLRTVFVNHFSSNCFSNLDFMVDTWRHNPLLFNRFHIFKECVCVLKDSTCETSSIKNPHCIVIPVLIAQIDGVMTTYLSENGFAPDDKHRKDIFGKIVTDLLKNNYGTDISVAKFLLNECTTAKDLLLDVLFQRAVYKDEMGDLKQPFSRNKIMHGQVLDYGNIENTIRLFLLIDFLASLRG